MSFGQTPFDPDDPDEVGATSEFEVDPTELIEVEMLWQDENLQNVKPAVDENVEWSITGNVNSHTDQCGNTTTDVNGDKGITLTVKGILLESQKDVMVEARRRGASARVVNPIETTVYKMQDFTITKSGTMNTLKLHSSSGEVEESAFQFQMQLKEVQS